MVEWVIMAEKVIRVVVDNELWKRFRLLAIMQDKSAQHYVAELVQKEVDRARRVEDRRNARADRSGDGA
jgi:hypothetical protein